MNTDTAKVGFALCNTPGCNLTKTGLKAVGSRSSGAKGGRREEACLEGYLK